MSTLAELMDALSGFDKRFGRPDRIYMANTKDTWWVLFPQKMLQRGRMLKPKKYRRFLK